MKSIVCIGWLTLLSLFNTTNLYAQTPISFYACDTTLSDPGMNLPAGDYAYTIKSPNRSRMAYTVEYYNSNYGPVNIYDGPSTTSPLYTTLTDPFNVPGQRYGGQTNDSAITILFYAAGDPTAPQHFKIIVRCVETPQSIPDFQPIKALAAGGNIEKADYDHDGDNDLLIGGLIFRNDSYFDSTYYFERKSNPITNWNNIKFASADFDADGFKDIFITGFNAYLGGAQSVAAIYKNNGDGQFTLVTTTSFAGAERGGCAVVDFNNDGKPDISYTGPTSFIGNSNCIFKVYLNNGNFNFTDANITLPGITGLLDASMSWADSDGDGDKDLLINGYNSSNVNITKFYRRSGNTFTEMNIGLSPTSAADIDWVDVNMDGKPDIVNRGVATAGNLDAIQPEIFINAGNNVFNRLNNSLPALSRGSMDWKDYDGDNDLDVVLCGVQGSGTESAVFKNNGNGQFQRIGLDGYIGSSRIKWADFNNDGRLDVIGAGSNISGDGGYMIKNMGNDSFKVSSTAFTANQYYATLVAIEDFNNDGQNDILTLRELTDVDCNSNNTSTIVFGKSWQLSGVAKFTEVVNLRTLNGGSTDYHWIWGDFDSDGKLDVLATYEPENTYFSPANYLHIFKNEGNNQFSVAYNSETSPLPDPSGTLGYATCYKQVKLIDINNDGINELYTPCFNTIYKWNNNQWEILYSDYSGSSAGLIPGYVATGDYNNDGFMDVASSFRDVTVGGGTGNSFLVFYKNNGQGRLVTDSINSAFYASKRQIKFVDMDNDGDLDMIYGNGALFNRNGIFTNINNQMVSTVNLATGDFNQDGYNDFVRIAINQVFGSIKLAYNQQGTMFFHEKEHGYPSNTTSSNWNGFADVDDVDSDGDEDIIYSMSLCNGGTTILLNQRNFTQRNIKLVHPNGGEEFLAGSTQNIRWFGNQIGNTVRIELSVDSGRQWQLIVDAAASTNRGGAYTWTVSGLNSNQCLIRVRDNSSLNVLDQSQRVFSIYSPLIADAGNDTSICQAVEIQLGTTSVSGMSYSWTSDPVGFTSTMANPLVMPSGTTRYYLTVSDGRRTATDSVLITTYSCAARSANIFPNPSNNQITINLDQNTVLPVQFHLISASGSHLLGRTLNNLSNVIPVSGYDAGIYFYTIQSTEGQIIHSGRILIQH